MEERLVEELLRSFGGGYPEMLTARRLRSKCCIRLRLPLLL